MTHSAWNLSGNHSTSTNVRSASVLAFLALVMLALPRDLSAQFLSSPSTNRTVKDVAIEARILSALRRDPQLGPLNLGVHMSGGVANLSGPIPANDLKQRAVQIVQKIDGVHSVSTKDLYFSSAAQGRKRMSIVIQDDRPTQTRAASLPAPSSVSSTPADPASSLPILPPQKSAIPSASAGSGQQITLLAPEITAPSRHVPEAACLTGKARPSSPGISISAAIEQLRQREARYQQIRVRVEGATVYLVPGDTASEDVMMFAQTVRRLPGVRHVIMDSSSR